MSYLVFAVTYILLFGFVALGLYQLNKVRKLFIDNIYFTEEISTSFKKTGRFFIAFVVSILIVDIALLAWSKTSIKAIQLFSTEQIVFLILGYLLFFLSGIFKKGTRLQKQKL